MLKESFPRKLSSKLVPYGKFPRYVPPTSQGNLSVMYFFALYGMNWEEKQSVTALFLP